MVNLPLALIGGVIAIGVTDGIVSIASLVGFVTLFRCTQWYTLISHYHTLMRDDLLPMREAIVRGSLERMNPILVTALCAGLALVPLALAGTQPGNEIQSPMAIVILGRSDVVDALEHDCHSGVVLKVRTRPSCETIIIKPTLMTN